MPKRQNANSKQFDQKTEAFVALAGKSAGFPLRTISFSRFDAFLRVCFAFIFVFLALSSLIASDFVLFDLLIRLDWIVTKLHVVLSCFCLLHWFIVLFCLFVFVFVFLFVFEFVLPFTIVFVFVLIDAIDRFALTGLSPSCVISPHCW